MSTPAKQLKGSAARLARLMPAGPSTAARAPFVLLVVLILSGGLITLLLLNSSLSQGSFELSELKKKTDELTDEQQALQRDVDRRSAPDALERRARELGMVPGGGPAFLGPDGKVLGVPQKATAEPLPPSPQPSDTVAGDPSAAPSAQGAAPSGTPAQPDTAVSPQTQGLSGPPAGPGDTGPAPSSRTSPQPNPTTSGR
ncbi:septum formation initiator family protein [Streptomyces peucetius]|uniref:Septum formation initiator family protein n=1 Tax=Streptomyces peucetius TaxID=1950 RepID=A0ABY6I6N2_STRPE|nr:septum formation initiator family protein [Streptomyces peucetius]UYQ61627.1 septum formation initiator family protein [Streptomyces peucetius]